MESAVSLRNVTKNYGSFVLDHVNLELPKGCIIGLAGENGAGKTTLLRAILQMLNLDAGEIFINGEQKNGNDWKWKDEIGVVLSGVDSFGELTALQFGKCMSGFYSHWNQEQFLQYLKQFHIDEKKRIRKYSKGMKRKLDLASALSHEAKLLLLDEATGGLDPMVRDEFLEIFREFIQDEEHTVLLSTHIISDIEKAADYVIFLHEGKVRFFEEKDELLYQHGIWHCTPEEYAGIRKEYVAGVRKSQYGYEVLICRRQEAAAEYPDMHLERASIEDILIYQIKGEKE